MALCSRLTYKEALAWLYGLQRFGIKLGLENIRRLLDELGVGDRGAMAVSGSATGKLGKIVHVAGTNGKGSVCAMIDSICRAQCHRTGLFISPHLVTFRERISVDGKFISEEDVAVGLEMIRHLMADWDPHPTFFEVTTALAVKHFSDAKIDVAILETGLGGRLDATNAMQSTVSVITPIALDHERWLGKTIAQIATEKAGIIKPNVPVVSAPQQGEAEAVIRARAVECGSRLQFISETYRESPIGLHGQHQKRNAALAVAAIRAAGIDVGENAIVHGLAVTEWPARFQKWDERIIIDGAHNPDAARILVETWLEVFGDQKATLVLAMLSDKDLHAVCKALTPIADSLVLPRIRSERAAAPSKLAEIFSVVSPSLSCSITSSVRDALVLARAKPNPILITGSLHFAGEVLAHLRGEPAAFEECAQ